MKKTAASLVNRNHRRGGISVIALVVAAVVAIVAIGYFISRDGSIPVIEQEVKGLTRDVTQWTDKQIVAHPDLYFRYAIEQFKSKDAALDANKLGISREKAIAAQNHTEHAQNEVAYNKVLDAAKAAYKAAPALTDDTGKETGKKFPIVAGAVTFADQDDFNVQVGVVLRKAEVEKKLAESFRVLEIKLENALLKLNAQKTEIQLQLATAEGNLKLIETKKTIGEIEKVGADIKNIMVNCDIIAKETTPEKLTLADSAAASTANTASAANAAAVADFLSK